MWSDLGFQGASGCLRNRLYGVRGEADGQLRGRAVTQVRHSDSLGQGGGWGGGKQLDLG